MAIPIFERYSPHSCPTIASQHCEQTHVTKANLQLQRSSVRAACLSIELTA